MLFAYTDLFFRRIFAWTLVALALLLAGASGIAPEAAVAVPFVVPFAFLETGYLFWYTIFARRHSAYLERTINARLGSDLLVAHRLEGAYFDPPGSRLIAAFAFARPLSFPSAMTLGYAIGAALVWLVGLSGLVDLVEARGGTGLLGLAVPAALAWTAGIALYLCWTFLSRHDEQRLIGELERCYPAARR